tara:strand:- start:39 stop:218 length:180 start_codon:yes stop_codon:yes gene_type:complete
MELTCFSFYLLLFFKDNLKGMANFLSSIRPNIIVITNEINKINNDLTEKENNKNEVIKR